MEGKISKRELTTLVIGIISLVVLTLGATFAYFQVAVTDTSGTTTITGDIGGATLGTVTLTGGDTELYLGISPYDMSESKKGTTYYSSTEEGSRETSKGSAGKTTYTATLSGDTTNTVMYACDYEFTVSASGTMLGKTSTENVEVVFEGDINRTLQLSSSNTVRGTWYGFKESNKERSFNAYLQLTNTDSPQNDLAGTNASIEIENSKFECYLSKNEELIGEAYAVKTITDDSKYNLYFVRSETPISVEGTHNGESIIAVYTGFESGDDTPWFNDNLNSITFEDKIRPISTASWFSEEYLSVLDLTNLDTSNVTSMNGMFYGSNIEKIIGLDSFDTSNVTKMAQMFAAPVWGPGGKVTLNKDSGINNWDVSSVTDMNEMFYGATLDEGLDLSNWNVSNVTDMSFMFYYSTINTDIGIGGWDVSNVTNMRNMFDSSTINIDLDLSSWDVSKVTDYRWFNDYISGTGTLTIPPFQVCEANQACAVVSGRNNDYTLTFFKKSTPIILSYLPSGEEKVAVYTNIESSTYNSSAPWNSYSDKIKRIVVEDEIRPVSTAYWFQDFSNVQTWDLAKLNVSLVKDMTSMFSRVNIKNDFGISNWDVSNVTNMSNMFDSSSINAELDISGWDVSNVTNMSCMFVATSINKDIGISSWNVSSVTNMSNMFLYAYISPDIDLSGWDVSKVTDYASFNDGASGITPPNFG